VKLNHFIPCFTVVFSRCIADVANGSIPAATSSFSPRDSGASAQRRGRGAPGSAGAGGRQRAAASRGEEEGEKEEEEEGEEGEEEEEEEGGGRREEQAEQEEQEEQEEPEEEEGAGVARPGAPLAEQGVDPRRRLVDLVAAGGVQEWVPRRLHLRRRLAPRRLRGLLLRPTANIMVTKAHRTPVRYI
jgi:hypothetical protein